MSGNIVLITADSLRADFVSCLNPDSPAKTPVLDSLAEEGMLFSNATSNGPGTVLSVPSLLTGELFPAVDSETPTVAEILREAEYTTGAFCTNIQLFGPVLSPMELDRGFETFDTLLNTVREKTEFRSEWMAQRIGEGIKHLFGTNSQAYKLVSDLVSYAPLPLARPTPPAETVNEKFLKWVNDVEEPYFAWLFHLDTHEPYLPPDDWINRYNLASGDVSRRYLQGLNRKFRYFKETLSDDELDILQELYVATVEYWDTQLGELIQSLRERGDEPTFIITSDHGELFGEHNQVGHPSEPWSELLDVPLVISGPSIDTNKSAYRVQNADVAETIARLVGSELPSTYGGKDPESRRVSLLNTDEIPNERGTVSVISYEPLILAYRTADWTYLKGETREELYAVGDEYKDQRRQNPEIADELCKRLKKSTANLANFTVERSTTDEETARRLRSLGYLDE